MLKSIAIFYIAQINMELQGLLATGSDSFELETTDDMYFVVERPPAPGAVGAGSALPSVAGLGAGAIGSKKRLSASVQ